MAQAEEKNNSTPADKPEYSAPELLLLGELARGSGVCGLGSSPGVGVDCTNGLKAYLDCISGSLVD